jgi:tetratricopeptide (TPR) repeat protein
MRGKPELTPPPTASPFASDPRISRLKIVALVAFIILVVAAVGVVVILPSQLNHGPEAVSVTPAPPASKKPPAAKQPAAATKQPSRQIIEARKLLKEALSLQADLEADGVKKWGTTKLETSYPETLDILTAADTQLDSRDYVQAAMLYRQAVANFQQLRKSKQVRFRKAMQTGREAMTAQDGVTAAEQFEIARALEPDNAEAAAGLRRAQSLGEVLALVELGMSLVAGGALEDAKRAFAEAVALDDAFLPAREHLARTEDLLEENAYRKSLSAALVAAYHRNFAGAEKALETARSLRPDAKEVREIAYQIREGRQGAKLARLRIEARRHSKNEQWAKALTAFEAALAVDGDAGFAVHGKTKAQNLLALNQNIDRYLADPDRLSSPEPLAHAGELADHVAAMVDAGPRLLKKAAKLEVFVAKAVKPYPVLLRSDNQTDVMVQPVGKLGRFAEHRFTLRPGNYTAIGSRRGYRDVRVKFRVPFSGGETIIVVRCEDPI